MGGQQKRKMSFEICPVDSRVLTDEDEEEGGTISSLPSHFFLQHLSKFQECRTEFHKWNQTPYSLVKVVNLFLRRIHTHANEGVCGAQEALGMLDARLQMFPTEWLVPKDSHHRLPITLEVRRTQDFALSQVSQNISPKAFPEVSMTSHMVLETCIQPVLIL